MFSVSVLRMVHVSEAYESWRLLAFTTHHGGNAACMFTQSRVLNRLVNSSHTATSLAMRQELEAEDPERLRGHSSSCNKVGA